MPKKIPESVKLLRKILEKTGMEQYKFAQLIGAPPSTVNRWMRGVYKMGPGWRQAIEHHPKLQGVLREIRDEADGSS